MVELLIALLVVCLAYVVVQAITGNSTLALVAALVLVIVLLARQGAV